jgi:hypothetical protein
MRTIGIAAHLRQGYGGQGSYGHLDADVVTGSMADLPPDTFDRLVPS